ncbi:MAG: endonuclease domain-containing protein [Planctomycetes bacterium]|nr:endonuclease domain-containing protein [Planctomycetota bacterium]
MVAKNRERAKDLRRDQTPAEHFLWDELRAKRFHGYKFRRQVPIGNYIVDFVCLERKIIIELDGGQHTDSHHRTYDSRRDHWLRSEGFSVLRFWNSDVFHEWEAMAERILHALQAGSGAKTQDPCRRKGHIRPSPPTPLPKWERGEVGWRGRHREWRCELFLSAQARGQTPAFSVAARQWVSFHGTRRNHPHNNCPPLPPWERG